MQKLKFFNSLNPLKSKLEESLKQAQSLEEQLQTSRSELKKVKQIYEEEKKGFSVSTVDNQKLYYELADLKAQLQQANYKRDNFDRLKLLVLRLWVYLYFIIYFNKWTHIFSKLILISKTNLNQFSERDDLERKLNDSEARYSAQQATNQVLAKERDDLTRNVWFEKA